jgi:hypothetical protein
MEWLLSQVRFVKMKIKSVYHGNSTIYNDQEENLMRQNIKILEN